MRILQILKREWLQLVILIAPFVVIAVYWSSIPETVPVHWNFSGKVNGYASKFWGVFLTPLLNIGLALLLAFLPQIDPKKQVGFAMRPIKALRITVTAFIMIFSLLIVGISLGKPIDMAVAPAILLPLLFLVIGNYLPQTRPNYFVGVRTPWTLEDPENWRLTHVFTGRLWVIASIVVLILDLVIPSAWTAYIMIPFIMLMVLPPLIYSYITYRRLHKALQ